jgi:hypothetical protein
MRCVQIEKAALPVARQTVPRTGERAEHWDYFHVKRGILFHSSGTRGLDMQQKVRSDILHPHPLTSVMQLSITAASLCVAAGAITFAIKSMADERNARLVEIGVGILRVDPEKESQVGAAREWALDLIDANAGGVRFSKDARMELLKKRLGFDLGFYGGGYTDYGSYDGGYTDYGSYSSRPLPPKEKRPLPQSN